MYACLLTGICRSATRCSLPRYASRQEVKYPIIASPYCSLIWRVGPSGHPMTVGKKVHPGSKRRGCCWEGVEGPECPQELQLRVEGAKSLSSKEVTTGNLWGSWGKSGKSSELPEGLSKPGCPFSDSQKIGSCRPVPVTRKNWQLQAWQFLHWRSWNKTSLLKLNSAEPVALEALSHL